MGWGPAPARCVVMGDNGEKQERPLVLLTNDDGIEAKGLAALAEALEGIGELAVFAPDRDRSGVSQMITLHRPLRCHEVRPRWWSVDGTPVDCVYLALHGVLPRRPTLLVSGINAGPNLSFDVLYSGTVAAAREGVLHDVPSIAVSLVDGKSGRFEVAASFARMLVQEVLKSGLARGTLLNVNAPGGDPKAYQMTFLGHRLFHHGVEQRFDPRGGVYYWIGGVPAPARDLPGSDCNAVLDGNISVTPLDLDFARPVRLPKPICVSRFDVVPAVSPPEVEF